LHLLLGRAQLRPVLSPPGATSATSAPYYYRYYSGTGNFLAASENDNHLWALGKVTGGKLVDLGPTATSLAASGCSATATTATLPPCGTATPYDTLPIALQDFSYVSPLGNINPQAHTAPTNHIYFAYTGSSTKQALAPGNIHITQVVKKTYTSTGATDFQVHFSACKEVTSWYDHIVLEKVFDDMITNYDGGCVESSASGTTLRSCTANALDITVGSGTLLGKGGTSNNLDFGTRDSRLDLAFINPDIKKTFGTTACPIDYFTADIKLALESRLGNFDGTLRSDLPKCGRVDHDLAGTAQGLWILPGKSSFDERNLLTLAPHSFRDGKQAIAIGTDANASTNDLAFTPKTTGLVNRDFAQVRFDGNTYCYESLIDARNGPAVPGQIVIVRLTSDAAVTIERKAAASCGTGPWTFTTSAESFVR